MALVMTSLSTRLWSALFPLLVAVEAVHAQTAGMLRGRVTDKSTGNPVARAQVNVPSHDRSVFADGDGRYSISGLPAGVSKLVVHAEGFPTLRVDVEMSEGAVTDKPIELDSTEAGRLASAQSLPAVPVTATAKPVNYRLADFERRRQNGRGQYLTESEIVKSGAYTLPDAIKNMRGVIYDCGGGSCHVHMAQAPVRCLPEYVVDGQEMNDFGPTTPIRDVVAIEVYTGPTEVPGEYAGRNAGCGVVVVWTRSGPTRKQE
jgi:hypothetical protein